MHALLRISRGIDAFTDWIGKQLTWMVTVLVLVGFLNVIGRFLGRYVGLRLTSNAIIEFQWYLFSILFFLGFAYILRHNLNVRVDFLYAKMTPKQQALVDFIGHLLFFVAFCILGIAMTYGPVMRSWGLLRDGSWGTWELSPDPDGLPRAPIKSMIIVSFALLLLQTISELIKYLAVLTNHMYPEALEKHAGHDVAAE